MRQPEPRRGKSSGAGAKPEQPVCEQAVAFTFLRLEELKLLSFFTKHFHVQVTVGAQLAGRISRLVLLPFGFWARVGSRRRTPK